MSRYVKQLFINPIYDFLPILMLVILNRFVAFSVVVSIASAFALLLFISSFFFRNKILSWNVFVFLLLSVLFFSIAYFSSFVEFVFLQKFLPEILVLAYFLFFIIFQIPIKKYLKKKNVISTYCYFEEYYRLLIIFFSVFSFFLLFSVLCFYFKREDFYLHSIFLAFLIAVIVYEFIRVRVIRDNFRKEEWYPIVNSEGHVIGKIEKKESLLSEQKFLHPVIRVHIIVDNMIYLQKRVSSDLIFPEKWDTAISNHVHFGETIGECVAHSAKIRYGLKEINPIYLTKYQIETNNEKQLAFVYYTNQIKHLKPLCPNIEQGKFWPITQVCQELNSGIFTPNFIKEFELLCEKSLCCKVKKNTSTVF